MLLVSGATEMWADAVSADNIIIRVMPGGTEGKGSVNATEGSISASISDRVVTLTVTPESGYKIKKDLIVVEKMVDPSRFAARRRTPSLGDFPLTGSDNWQEAANTYTFTVPADYDGAYVTATFVSTTANQITSLSEITDLTGNYELIRDVDASSFSTISGTFSGTINGGFHKIYNLGEPLFNTLTGTVKNLTLEDVSISGHTGNTGAIACTANEAARIYNCGILSGSVGGTAYTGGLVGYLDGSARVINCYSYANITGGTTVAGIVGFNTTATMQGNNQTNFDNNVKTMVMNCMFYGDITGGTTKRPVYGGTAIVNNAADKVNNYNYYCEENATFDNNYSKIEDYNFSWPVAKKYLTRFEVYRNILNTNRRLCTWWVSGTYNNCPTDADVETIGIAKWVLDPTIAPYPILKPWGKYYSSFDMDPENVHHYLAESPRTVSRALANAWEGKSNGTLSVTINGGSNNSSASDSREIVITDMDTLSYDYCAKKIQLPYYNEVFGNPNGADWAEKYGNNYTGKVVTGWEITAVYGGTAGTFDGSSNHAWEDGYNFADRQCTSKDLYATSGRVFAQGGYYYVPDGVTSITITAHWADAVYLCNPNRYLDRVNNGGNDFYISGKLPEKVNNTYTVQTSLSNALGQLKVMPSGTVYDQAVVLVGNYQNNNFDDEILLSGNNYNKGAKPFTIMSADFDLDNEPDFCFQAGMYNGGRVNSQPIRFDFLMAPDITMSIRANTNYYGMRIWVPQGHFEVTETAYMYTTQFEYDERNAGQYAKHEAPLILNGGEHMQIVSSEAFGEANENANAGQRVDATSYILMGGKVYMKAFTPGCHGNKRIGTRHCAVNAIGGEYPEFYLSGMFRSDFYNMTDNPHAYLDGGKFGTVAGAGMESVGKKDETNGGNVTFKINNSWINEFYGGGINANRPVTGNISITCDNSIVHKYCGGPKVGDMSSSKTITNTITNTVFDQFYGGGNGGTNNERRRIYDSNGAVEAPTESNRTTVWNSSNNGYFNSFNPFRYDGNGAYETIFEFELLPDTRGNAKVVKRTYSYWASFAKTTVAPVTNTITDCTFNGNFYGGGNLGAVGGNVTSTLTGHTVVKGSAFGAGYSAAIPSFKVHDKSTVVFPYRDFAGFIHDGSLEYNPTEYTWIHDIPAEWNISPAPSTSKPTFSHEGKWYCYTPEELTGLGAVSGSTTITIEGTTEVKGNVYGGGDMSAVNTNSNVVIQGSAVVAGDVFGAGNAADVEGAATVDVASGTMTNVYGGGKGETTIVGGDITVNIGAKSGESAPFTYTGTGTVMGSVYGGSALGAVNATKDPSTGALSFTTGKKADVNIYAGTINGSVYGGGRGDLASLGTGHADVAAQNFGNVTVNIENTDNTKAQVKNAVYGGSNANGVLKGDATVTITGGTVGTTANPATDVVFGGGFGEPTLVNGNVTVNIGTSGQASGGALINGNIYGGGALGSVNTSKPASELVFDATKKVDVNLYKGTISGNVFGGGLGQKNGENGAESDILSYVGGDVNVTLDGAKIPGQIFGCNNLNGTPKGHVKVWVKKTIDSTKNTETARESRITNEKPVDVAAVYGGGNKADYIPTNVTLTLNENAEGYDAGNPDKVAAARTEVIIEGCNNTSIGYVYGGGNAAAVPATEVTIKGSYIIDYVFGGGNGSGEGNPGANVGIYKLNGVNTNYGTGKAATNLLGGYINNVYGGSNTKGDIRGGTNVRTKEKNETVSGDCCTELKAGKIYGAGSHADVNGDVRITLECMPEDYVAAVYGGAEQATVKGDVVLTVTSGKFGRVFGGNNAGGDIQGSITVNVYEDGCKPLIIGELYGGGNAAPYSIYGCTGSGSTWTANTSGTTYYGTEEPDNRTNVEVNVYSCTSIGKVFGGGKGATAQVIGNTHVWINPMKGVVDTNGDGIGELQPSIGKVGQVFGGGALANVKGNTLVDIGTSLVVDAFAGGNGALIVSGDDYLDPESNTNISITSGVYGGGSAADVDGDATLNIGTKDLPLHTVITGNIFGGGLGENTHVTGNVTVNIGEDTGTSSAHNYVGYANITGDVYGGSAKGKVNSHLENSVETATTDKETQVNLYGGTITGNLYGGGLGDATYAADVYGPVIVNVEGGNVYNVFGCNNTNGTPKNTVAVNIDGGAISQSVYGGGNLAIMDGSPVVNVTDGTIGTENQGGAVYGNVYGGGLGSNTAVKAGLVKGNTAINISGGTILHNIYGGGAHGSVGDFTYDENDIITGYTAGGKATISITGGTIGTTGRNNGMVFGSSRGDIGAPDGIHDKLAWVYDTEVNIGTANDATAGPAIKGSVYGGGENGHNYHDAEVKIYSGTIGIYTETEEDVEYKDDPDDNTRVTYSGKDYNYPYRGNVYGAGCGTDKYDNNTKYNPKAGIVLNDAKVSISGGLVVHNVYGAGAMGSVKESTTVTISGGTIGVDGSDNGNVYAAARGEENLTDPDNYASVQSTTLNISGGEVKGSAFGGGQAGIVKGSVAVNVSGGKVINDVYGGGALANTNTENWSFSDLTPVYIEVTGLTYPSFSVKTGLENGNPLKGYYTESGGNYTEITDENATYSTDAGITYYQRHPGSYVKGLYTESGGNYTEITDEDAEANSETTYYEVRQLPGTWAVGKTSTSNTTTVTLTGGVIGNVYGGGLGAPNHPVYVCGDVLVSVNDDENGTISGVGFTNRSNEHVTIEGDDKEYVVPITGRVFGCNNIKGTPLGDVHVHVYSTRQLDESGNVIAHVDASSHTTYEIQAVYGGGNQANYVPTDGKGTHVMIDGCQATTIKKVYGGGSSASVPATDVLIKAALDIGFAFGGGNGGEKVYDYEHEKWINNTGASVNGQSKIECRGGKIGQIFGGSDSKGDCRSVSVTQNQQGTCPLIITRMYGAGNEADVTGDVTITISGCTAGNTEIEYVCGGSYNAHITGNVNLTITSGFFKSVYGGNESSGSIGGNITVNIEETNDCKPIIIENLVGGGNMAPYPGTLRNGTEITTPGNITVNVKSATRIDNVYGGGYESEALGNTTVNINMTKGAWAGKTYTGNSEAYPNAIGVIGNVYGGGNSGRVKGNTTVNIGTATSVGYVTEPLHIGTKGTDYTQNETDHLYYAAVVGANITGNVFGGGNKAEVTGDSQVNICATGVTYNNETHEYDYTSVDFSNVTYPTGTSYEGVKIGGNVYGGGNLGSVGTYNHLNTLMPTSCTSGGKCIVTIGGDAQIGPASMPANFLSGYTKVSPTKGVVEDFKDERFVGHVFGGCKGNNNIAEDANVLYKSWSDMTYVTIGDNAFVKGSVYGGSENGHVLHDTNVRIKGGQIGCGAGQTAPYAENQFIETPATVTAGTALAECPHWEYGRIDTGTTKEYKPHDLLANSYDSKGGATIASDGHTYYGNVFGGGSGAFPYAAGKWLDSAGQVYGNTKVTITGGHILTSIYGGNEMTNVLGDSCVVIMRGGTLGVPRTLSQIAAHPVTCYLFGAGKGDTRTLFNTWTNVKNTRVHVGGTAKIYGSVFGGGEDGHVLENVKLGIYGGSIGTTGTSYVDGNVFGGGRGYTGNSLTAGSVHGNVNIAIAGGTMLGSVYGGGRLASVGINMVDATLPNGSPNPEYGLLNDDTAGDQYGHVTINISGGNIGNTAATGDGAKYSGNVFGGSMGRLTQLDEETLNPLWPKLAAVKLTDVTINGTANIVRNVYGGGEYGVVRNGSTVTIDGNSIVGGNVFGGGYGSNRTEKQTIAVAGYDNTYYTFTPMAWAGCVSGNTKVNIRGGWVKTNVYGGGEYASVGLIDFVSNASGDFTNMTKHDNPENGFALSWPYEFHYHAAAPNDLPAVGGGSIGGKATVEVTGGRIGITGKDYRGSGYKEDGVTPLTEAEEKAARTDNGDIYGGSKGFAGNRYEMALCANVKEAEVIINYSSPTATPENYKTGADVSNKGSNDCIAGSVYGGGENGHVIGNTSVTLTNGLIGHAIYGGGKGKDTYKKTLDLAGGGTTASPVDVYSITAGKVYGNTSVTMTGGYVVRNIYGGGNLASVGKGNYAGGSDDYTTGYGEKITTALWSNTDFTGSGKTTVSVTGGQVGYIDTDPSKTLKDDLPYGNIYGGCRGQGTAEVDGININPDFYVGYANETEVTIGTAGSPSSNPRIYGSVYGGGQDGHVRRDTKVTINNGEIGAAFVDNSTADGLVGTHDINNNQWLHRGNVYGGGSGIGKYEFDYNRDGSTWTDADSDSKYDEGEENTVSTSYGPFKERGYSSSAGSVTHNTTVEIKGGTIHRNVYGGGSLASVLPPGWTMSAGPYTDAANGKVSANTLNITGGTIGNATDHSSDYGGNVFGASRGMENADINSNYFAISTGTLVNILPHPTDRTKDVTIAGNVYGGGEMGIVKQNTNVQLTGGIIDHDVYGGGKGTYHIAANVGNDATVELNKGVADDAKGCIVDRIFGCNDMNGSPKGHVLVHVYATQNSSASMTKITDKFPKRPANRKKEKDHEDEIREYLKTLIDATHPKDEGNNIITDQYLDAKINSTIIANALTTYNTYNTGNTLTNEETAAVNTAINTAINNVMEELCKLYDVQAVYGGGNLAPYMPKGPNATATDDDWKNTLHTTEVIIEGCDVTSIRQVYGSGNAASTPATDVEVKSAYEIDELFGGGNGYDPYRKENETGELKWYENPGANVGYVNYISHSTTTEGKDGSEKAKAYPIGNEEETLTKSEKETYRYGTGYAVTNARGGRIHAVYGGSNQRGNISTMAMSAYQNSANCTLVTDETYGAGKSATLDGEVDVSFDCVTELGTIYGGAKDANLSSGITLNITNGTYTNIYGGNNESGTIDGPLTINIRESGCSPVIIGGVYAGGFKAAYSVYGYKNTGTAESPIYEPRTKADYDALSAEEKAKIEVHRDPRINVISATRIGEIYGGGYQGLLVGNPHINVNMEKGMVTAEYAKLNSEPRDIFTVGTHGEGDNAYTVESYSANGDAILALGTIGTIYGGGNDADVYGNTHVEIGTGQWMNNESFYEMDATDGITYTYKNGNWTYVEEGLEKIATTTPTPVRNKAVIKKSVYGGGKMGHVGEFTFTNGKPTNCAAGTGECHIIISNGEIGPNDMAMYHLDNEGNFKTGDEPDNDGHVFGGGQGTNQTTDVNKAYVDSTEVIINGTAWVKGSVFGGGESGHVLHNTGVKIGGNCQIGNGHILLTKVSEGADNGTILVNQGINRRYTDAEWTAGHLILGDGDLAGVSNDNKDLITAQYANSLPECDSWLYGKTISAGKVTTSSSYAPHDIYAGTGGYDSKGGALIASDGRVFNGSVYGGGSGYFPYEAGKWLKSAGQVEGDTWVEVTGGHILTSLYGGCEMTTVKGDAHVTMTGGTVGVPRTLDEIAAHPVTCYVFGGGKGDGRSLLNDITNIEKDAYVTIGGDAWVYGSVFGGAEDGWINGNTHLKVLNGTTKTVGGKEIQFPLIGTWGTSYVDGNIFGGGRGFDGSNKETGRVGGNTNVDILGGTMLGSVYGGGRLGSVGINSSGTMQADDSNGTHGHVTVNIEGGTIGNDLEYINPTLTGDAWTTAKAKAPNTDYDDTNHKLLHTKGGNVFAASMGRRTALDGSPLENWKELGSTKSTKLTISGANTWIKSNVYGGGEFAPVTGYHTTNGKNYGTEIVINGGTIGTEITSSTPVKATIEVPTDGSPSDVKYTFGSVYGGGYGTDVEKEGIETHNDVDKLGAYVADSTYIKMTTGLVRASVYGGGEVAAIGGSTNINISGGKIGRNEVYGKDTETPGLVKFGGAEIGNVYGGGNGTNSHTLIGIVKGNATINISAGEGVPAGEPFIYHNVYGGGAYGSLGTFIFSDGVGSTPGLEHMAKIPKGIPLNWTANTGIATINVKGGTIGISGRDNGMIYGSSRGDIAKPVETILSAVPGGKVDKDPYDKMAWVEKSIVNIGETGKDGPHINGSVFGGGENGHVFTHAAVNVKSGTIGVLEGETWYDFGDDEINKEAWTTRGNVYGGGCGVDTYTGDDGKKHHNAWAGCIIGNTDIAISGGHITQNVYGGGSMGSVGRIVENETKSHKEDSEGFKLSWPTKFVYENLSNNLSTGKATINITGGRIGTTGSDNGDVFGGTRGKAGERYDLSTFGNVRETEIIVNYTTPATANDLAIVENIEDGSKKFSLRLKDGANAIAGSVYGGGENGHVNENAKVDVRAGLIGHAIYGGGKGKGTYISNDVEYPDLTAGKVYGNTTVTMSGGHVIRNIYGGGNLGSVGKGNYASGADDYYPSGYGESISGNLWTSAFDSESEESASNVKDNAWYFLNSGKATVNVTGGTIGFLATTSTPVMLLNADNTTFTESTYGDVLKNNEKKKALIKTMSKDSMPTGNIFGGCRGQAAAEVTELDKMNFEDNPILFLGYTNETDVTIGDNSTGPTIYGSVYGGGQDGHVRRGTKVTINNGSIGVTYTEDNQKLFGTFGKPLEEELNDIQWMHRGNVYGGGSGIGKYKTGEKDSNGKDIEENSHSAGSVTHNTTIDIKGGTIHRNVYGGGSVASVCPPFAAMSATKPNADDSEGLGKMSANLVQIAGTIGTPDEFIPGFKFNKNYGGEVYGASRGDKTLDPESFSLSVWTKVIIKAGAKIMNNVFGGGDAGKVLKNSEVVVGEE